MRSDMEFREDEFNFVKPHVESNFFRKVLALREEILISLASDVV